MTDASAGDNNANADQCQDSWYQQQADSTYSDKSINEGDFLADVDYQWLCGYGSCAASRTPQLQQLPLGGSVPAGLAAQMGAQLYNEQLSYHVDATLAEVDMDEYFRGDINKVLQISGYDTELYEEQEMFNNISMDSLDCSSYEAEKIAQSCCTNMNNYTIAFEGSINSSINDYKFAPVDNGPAVPVSNLPIYQSVGHMTTWSEQQRPMPASLDSQSKSLPDPLMNTDRGLSSVPVYDVNHHHPHHQQQQQQEISSSSLFRLYIKQRRDRLGTSSCCQSSCDQLTAPSDSSDCPMKSESESEPAAQPGGRRSDTSSGGGSGLVLVSEKCALPPGSPRTWRRRTTANVSQQTQHQLPAACVDHSIQTSTGRLADGRCSVYVCYPHYSLPNLQFLEHCPIRASLHLCPRSPTLGQQPQPRRHQSASRRRGRRPYSCNDIETLRRANLSHIRDWSSLRLLLPQQFQQVVDELGYTQGEAAAAAAAGAAAASVRLHSGQCGGRRAAPSEESRSGCCHQPSQQRTAGNTHMTESQRKGILRRTTSLKNGACERCRTEARKSLQEPLKSWLHNAAEFAAVNSRDLGLASSPLPEARLNDSCETAKLKRVSFSDSNQEYEDGEGEGEEEAEGRRPGSDGLRLELAGCSDRVVKTRTPSPSQAQRVIIVDREGFKGLLDPVAAAVDEIVAFFQSNASSAKAECTGDSGQRPASGYLVLDRLCPALYCVLSHGLLTRLDTAFGEVNNSVWKVVESVTSLGTCPQTLQDLVMKLNNEDGLSESVLKFNAFIFGLLNTQSLDSWMTYLRTRESIVRKHYSPEALLFQANSGCRAEYDTLVLVLQRLAQYRFRIDLLFESRILFQSMSRLGRRLQNLSAGSSVSSGGSPGLRRPRSTVESASDGTEPFQERRDGGDSKRWSGLDLSSRLLQALGAILTQSQAAAAGPLDEDDADHERNRRAERRDNAADINEDDDPTTADDIDNDPDENDDDLTNPSTNTELSEDCLRSEEPSAPARAAPPDAEPKVKSRREPIQRQQQQQQQPPPAKTNRAKFHRLQQQWEKMARGQTAGSSRIPRPVSAGRPGSGPGAAGQTRPSQIPKASSAPRRRPAAHKQEKEAENRARGAGRGASGRRIESTELGSPAVTGNKAVEQDSGNGRRVRTLSHYHASDRSYLTYGRSETLTVVGLVDRDWMLCARNSRVGLVARRNVIDVP